MNANDNRDLSDEDLTMVLVHFEGRKQPQLFIPLYPKSRTEDGSHSLHWPREFVERVRDNMNDYLDQ